jgi:hypothetical protein
VKENDFTGRVKILTLYDDGLDYTRTNEEVSINNIDQLNKIKAEIITGQIKVYNNIDNKKSNYSFDVYNF